MFAQTFQEWMGEQIFILIFVLGGLFWLARKFAASNPTIVDAAKQAGTRKAIGFIERLFR